MRRRFSFSAVGFSTLVLPIVVVLSVVQMSSFAKGDGDVISCVQCGYKQGERRCGQVLPRATRCGKEHIGCLVGAYITKRTGYVQETRRCDEKYDPYFIHDDDGHGYLFGLLCNKDDCNSDLSARRTPFPERHPAATTRSVSGRRCRSASAQVGGGSGGQSAPNTSPALKGGRPLECIQCGWRYGEPCGRQLPPAKRCPKKSAAEEEYRSCFNGVALNKTTGAVVEIRGCTTQDAFAFTDKIGDDILIFAVACVTGPGCNSDGGPPVNRSYDSSSAAAAECSEPQPIPPEANGGNPSPKSVATPLLLTTTTLLPMLMTSDAV